MNTAGVFTRAWTWLFGARVERLAERKNRAHFLSYLLICAQSIAVLLVFGHAEVGLLFDPRWPLKFVAMLVLALLVITVLAADWALIESITRLGPLGRNQQTWAWLEHFIYASFVFIVEGVTFGVVLVALDSNPTALVNWQPLIPTSGALFYAIVTLRALLTGWACIQLILVRAPLPVLLSTLMNTGKEIIGAQLERMLKSLDLTNQNLPALFQVYAAMSKPRRPSAGWFGWRLKAAIAREEEDNRQAKLIYDGLAALAGTVAPTALSAPAPAPRALPPRDPFGLAAEPTIHLPEPVYPTPPAHPTHGLAASMAPSRDSLDLLGDDLGGPDDDGPDGGGLPTADWPDTSEIPAVSVVMNGHSRHTTNNWPTDLGGDDTELAELAEVRVGTKRPAMTKRERASYSRGKELDRYDVAVEMLAHNPNVTVSGLRKRLAKEQLGTNDREAQHILRCAQGVEDLRWERHARNARDLRRFQQRAVVNGPITAPLGE